MLNCHILYCVNVVIAVECCQIDLVDKVLVDTNLVHFLKHTILSDQGVCHFNAQRFHWVGLRDLEN